MDSLKTTCGQQEGDWCTFISEVADHHSASGFMPIWSVGHNRGGEIHTFVMSCGVSAAGPHMKYKDPTAEDNPAVSLGRKCPKGLGDYSKGQPICDRQNRYRQDILNIENRFRTTSYDFRHFIDYAGILFCNAIDGFNYFHLNGEGDWMALAQELALGLMHNTYDADHRQGPGDSPRKRNREADESGTPSKSARKEQHTLVRLTSIEGYDGKRQTKCSIPSCQKDCGWACLQCSTGGKVIALHPPSITVKGQKACFDCLAAHRRAPHKSIPRRPRGKGAKRPRKQNA